MIPPKVANRRAIAQKIIAVTADVHGIPYSAMVTPSRKHQVVVARREAMRRIWKELGFPMTRIAGLFNMDVATVQYHIRRAR